MLGCSHGALELPTLLNSLLPIHHIQKTTNKRISCEPSADTMPILRQTSHYAATKRFCAIDALWDVWRLVHAEKRSRSV